MRVNVFGSFMSFFNWSFPIKVLNLGTENEFSNINRINQISLTLKNQRKYSEKIKMDQTKTQLIWIDTNDVTQISINMDS